MTRKAKGPFGARWAPKGRVTLPLVRAARARVLSVLRPRESKGEGRAREKGSQGRPREKGEQGRARETVFYECFVALTPKDEGQHQGRARETVFYECFVAKTDF